LTPRLTRKRIPAGLRRVRRALRTAALRSTAPLLLAAVPAAGARCEAAARGAQRPGGGGAGGPFPGDDLIIEQIAERIARDVEARPPACAWCCRSLSNGSAWCGDECEREWRKRLMPRPQRGGDPLIVPRIGKRQRDQALAAEWRAEHGLEP
jgi:hypothetical protein